MHFKQSPTESIVQFTARLRRLGSGCQYGDQTNVLFCDDFIAGVYNERIGECLLIEDHKQLTFDASINEWKRLSLPPHTVPRLNQMILN